MSTTPQKSSISRDDLVNTHISMLALTSAFVLARVALHISKRKVPDLTDFFIYFAFALYVAIWSCYIIVTPPMYRVYAVIDREAKPYATMMADAGAMLRFITAGQMCFYTLLFSVKMSLLTLYRKLLAGVGGIYSKIWWAIVAFCAISWIGCVLSSVFTCDDLNEKFTKGKCGSTPNENPRIIFSLFFAYAVDVATDIAIMALPIRLTWNLQMSKTQKAGMFVLFGSGWICIAFATLRVVQLGIDEKGRPTAPSPKWLLLWTILECSIAVMIGCSPAFAILIRNRLNDSKKASYDAHGYLRPDTDDIHLKNTVSSNSRSRRDNKDTYWDDQNSSQEELAKNAGRIVVKTTVQQDDEHRSSTSRLSRHEIATAH